MHFFSPKIVDYFFDVEKKTNVPLTNTFTTFACSHPCAKPAPPTFGTYASTTSPTARFPSAPTFAPRAHETGRVAAAKSQNKIKKTFHIALN